MGGNWQKESSQVAGPPGAVLCFLPSRLSWENAHFLENRLPGAQRRGTWWPSGGYCPGRRGHVGESLWFVVAGREGGLEAEPPSPGLPSSSLHPGDHMP